MGAIPKEQTALLKRGALAVLTSGTSEIQTGGGAYGDETLADTLFPKGINDWALDDRRNARQGKDAADAAEKAALDAGKPPPPMDFTDETLRAARSSALLRMATGRGRAGSFLARPAGSTLSPLGRKTALGG